MTAATLPDDVFRAQIERLRAILLGALQELRPGYVDPYPTRIPGMPPVPAAPSVRQDSSARSK